MIKLIDKKAVPAAVSIIYRAFHNVHGSDYFNDMCVKTELDAQFSEGPYIPKYYGVYINNKLVSVAGYAKSLFADNTYELRLAATDPDHMKKGYLTKLLLHRIKCIKKELNGEQGLIMLDTYKPEIYYKHGFELIKQWSDSNIMMLEVNNE